MNTQERRAAASCLANFSIVQKIIADAAKLKNAVVRAQVLEIIRCGLENADDTATVGGYAHESKLNLVDFVKDYPTREAYWESMFYGSAASMSTERRWLIDATGHELHGVARRWLLARGLLG